MLKGQVRKTETLSPQRKIQPKFERVKSVKTATKLLAKFVQKIHEQFVRPHSDVQIETVCTPDAVGAIDVKNVFYVF